MKVALVHDYLKDDGGAERVLMALHTLYPDAPIYTLIYAPQFLGPQREQFEKADVRPSFLNAIPYGYKFISIFRLIAPFVFRTFDFSQYDIIIISATGAYTPNAIRKKSALQICYSHTPPRYLYGFATAREWKKYPILRVIAEIANHFLRMTDYNSSKNVDIFIANSENVKKRIRKFYRRDAIVVYPPAYSASRMRAASVQLKNKKLNADLLDVRRYYLAGGRLARPKHFDLIIQACMELGVPLKIFGKGFAGYGEELKEISNFPISNEKKASPSISDQVRRYKDKSRGKKTTSLSASLPDSEICEDDNGAKVKKGNQLIEFLGEVSDEEKLALMRNAKAFIMAAEDEDFGIVPVEAMSMGTPVIAYRSGGLVESVVEGKTGIFFDALTVESLKKAIKKFEKMEFDPKDAIKQAEKFSEERFREEIKKVVTSNMK